MNWKNRVFCFVFVLLCTPWFWRVVKTTNNQGLIYPEKDLRAIDQARKNFFELIDPNLYFFANHPRERTGIKEFEKLPFFFLPFFISGLVLWIKRKTKWYWWGLAILPIVFLSLVTTDGLLCWLGARTKNVKKK